MEPGNPEAFGILMALQSMGQAYQALWELRVLVDTGCIHLLLGEVFCSYKLRFLEVRSQEVGVLEVGPPEVGSLEVGLEEVGVLEVGQGRRRLPHIYPWQPCLGEDWYGKD